MHLSPMNEVNVPESAQRIDDREPHGYTHTKTAVNLLLSEFIACVGQINPDRDTYLICHSGGRSAQAVECLEQPRRRDSVIHVAGGTSAWIEAGLPTSDTLPSHH